ncbi:terminase small subunit, partial [Candidatus Hakubella thermalkaliphila]
MEVAVKAEVLTPQQNELMPTGEGLTPRQKKFCDEYLLDYNGTRAYLAAYNTESESMAGGEAYTLLSMPKIVKYLQSYLNSIQINHQILRERVLQELSRVAFSNIFDYMEVVKDKRGKQVVQAADLTVLTPEQRSAIQSIRVSARNGDIT